MSPAKELADVDGKGLLSAGLPRNHIDTSRATYLLVFMPRFGQVGSKCSRNCGDPVLKIPSTGRPLTDRLVDIVCSREFARALWAVHDQDSELMHQVRNRYARNSGYHLWTYGKAAITSSICIATCESSLFML